MPALKDLTAGQVFSRKELQDWFGISNRNLYNGVFRHNESESVWLFVTENKTADRTPYVDQLRGDLLHWDGQTSGRTDPWIIDHKQRGYEILVFYRKSRSQYPHGGFQYEGKFEYVSHRPGNPSHFVLRRAPD